MIYGFDIGGTKTELAAFDDGLNRTQTWRRPTVHSSYDAFLDSLCDLVAAADASVGSNNAPIGVGLPGLVTREGRSFCANVPVATGHQVAINLAERTGRRVVCENDCRCFALSEATGGEGEGRHVVFGAIVGTGAAGGLVVDGSLLRGRQGIAGEYGHIQLSRTLACQYELPRLQCGCGLPDCLEPWVAGPGLRRLYEHFSGQCLATDAVMQSVRSGSPIAMQAFDTYLGLLGAAFAPIVMMYDPEVIVVGGGMSQVPEIIAGLAGATATHLFAHFSAPPILKARFGDASGARGAAILAQRIII